jgi:hypothetical protein
LNITVWVPAPDSGDDLVRDDIRPTYGRNLPSALVYLKDDFEASIAHLRFSLGPPAIRTTNLLERLFDADPAIAKLTKPLSKHPQCRGLWRMVLWYISQP